MKQNRSRFLKKTSARLVPLLFAIHYGGGDSPDNLITLFALSSGIISQVRCYQR